jgi:hypothetical protein
MVGPPDPRVGISGVILGSVSLLLPDNIGGKLGEKKAQGARSGALREWAREALAGSAAVDERSAGPYGVLAAVEKRQDKRVWEEGLAPDAPPTDSAAVLGRVKTALAERGVARKGLTAEGSALSPEPIRLVGGDAPQPLCPCHVLQDLPNGVWKAVAQERECLARSTPTVQRGRPSSTEQAARRSARTRQALPQQLRAVFQERSVLVTRRWKARERKRLLHRTRGLPPRRKRREILAHLYARFDRRWRTQPARDKRNKWRPWVKRFTWRGDTCKTVCAPHLEKALTLLEDTLLPAPSHAVERGHRRHHTRHKSGDRVRSTVG